MVLGGIFLPSYLGFFLMWPVLLTQPGEIMLFSCGSSRISRVSREKIVKEMVFFELKARSTSEHPMLALKVKQLGRLWF